VIDLTCMALRASPLMLPLVLRAARDIEQRLAEGAGLPERLALQWFLRERRGAKGPFVLLTARRMFTNAAADRLVAPGDEPLRRRLDLAASLIGRPQVLFLDEPTTGLDPRSRLVMWDIIRDLAADGTTLLLTTQYLDEADRLADRIAVVDRGRVIAEGTAGRLKRDIGGERLQLVVAPGHNLSAAARVLDVYALDGAVRQDPTTRSVDAPIAAGSHPITHVVRDLAAAGVDIDDIGVRTPSLDDVFLTLTGHRAVQDDGDEAEGGAAKKRGRGRRGAETEPTPADTETQEVLQ
jgi:ABC-2 type transport system ATP-binding protein